MKSGKNSLRQLIESTINAWCCCDTTDNDNIAELEKKIVFLTEENKLLYSNEQNALYALTNESDLLSAALIKLRAAEANNAALHAENDSAYKQIVHQEMWLSITTTISIFCGIAAAWGWLIVFGIVPVWQ